MNYTPKQILDKVIEIGGKIVDDKYLIVGIQSKADKFNKFDDQFHMFLGREYILSTTGTTNAGKNALLNFDKGGNAAGAAVWKTNMFYDDLYSYGLHKGKMRCLRQVAPIYYYRDNDKDEKAEEQGELFHEIIYANFHFCDYDLDTEVIKTDINGWSYACQVCNNALDYNVIIDRVQAHKWKANYALLKEW